LLSFPTLLVWHGVVIFKQLIEQYRVETCHASLGWGSKPFWRLFEKNEMTNGAFASLLIFSVVLVRIPKSDLRWHLYVQRRTHLCRNLRPLRDLARLLRGSES